MAQINKVALRYKDGRVIKGTTQDFLPGSWGYFVPTWVDLLTLAGSFGLFMTLFLLFCRYLPIIAMAEVKHLLPQADPHGHGPGEGGAGAEEARS